MTSESYTDHIDNIRDPRLLQLKQFSRQLAWDSWIVFSWGAGLVIPIILAIRNDSLLQVLKIMYTPVAQLLAGFIFNIPYKAFSLTNITYNLIYFLRSGYILILILLVVIIHFLSPEPYWFLLVIPLQVWIFWKTQRSMPKIARLEWERFKQNTGMTDLEIKENLNSWVVIGWILLDAGNDWKHVYTGSFFVLINIIIWAIARIVAPKSSSLAFIVRIAIIYFVSIALAICVCSSRVADAEGASCSWAFAFEFNIIEL